MKSGVLQLGDVTFDPGTRSLSGADGRVVKLRNKSKAVLRYLAQRPNRTVPKSEILEEIWTDVIASDESLVQCVADIRRVIGKDARHIVETVPRVGYRLNLQVNEDRPHRAKSVLVLGATATIALAGWLLWPLPSGQIADTGLISEEVLTSLPPGTDSEAAYLELLQGRLAANQFSLEDSLTAERHFRQAIALDRTYARAHAELGTLLAVRFENDWTVLYEADKQKALYYAQRAVELEPDLWLGHYALGRLHSVFADLDAAEAHLRTAMSLRPENEDARAYLGVVLMFQGRPDEAAAILKQAIASHPAPPFWYFFGLGHALYNIGQYSEAEDALTTCLALSDGSPYCLRYLIAVYGQMGDRDDAGDAVATYSATGQDASVSGILNLMTFHHDDDRAQLAAGLRLAGLPE